jgi:hypothetical protein
MKAKTFKVPETLGACADLILRLRVTKSALQAEVDKVDAQISAVEQNLINKLPADDADGVVGRLAKAVIQSKTIPTVEEDGWPKVYAFILESAIAEGMKKGVRNAQMLARTVAEKANFDLLQRRLNTRAVTDRWEAKEAVPGVTKFIKKTVSVTKR